MKIITKIINAIILIALLNACAGIAKNLTKIDYNENVKKNTALLNKVPAGKASVGTLLYWKKNGNLYMLIGKENNNKKGGGTWCELGGSVKKNESFLAAVIRETSEESGGTYLLNSDYIIKHGITHHTIKPNGREELYIILEAPAYYTGKQILEKINKQTKNSYKEKVELIWVLAKDLFLCNQNRCVLQDIKGHRHNGIKLRNFFQEILKDLNFKEKIKIIQN